MATRDEIPKISSDQEFPLGSLVDIAKQAKAESWLSDIQKLDRNHFIRKTWAASSPPVYTITSRGIKNHHASIALCTSWDYTMSREGTIGFQYAEHGYRAAMAFNLQTEYLPKCTIDFTEQIRQMRNPDEQLYRAREFGHAAWIGMQMYTDIHATFNSLLEYAKTRFDLIPDDNFEYFRAGLTLPYMVSLAGELERGTPKYSSFNSYDENGKLLSLQDSDFKRFFTNGATYDTDKRTA